MQHKTVAAILISALMVTGFFVVILNFYGELNDQYTVNNYYTENLTAYEESFDSVQTQTEAVNEAINDLASGNIADILGGLLQGTISVLGLFKDSFIAIGNIFVQSVAIFEIGDATGTWVAIAASSVLILFLMFIIKKVR